MVTILEPKSSGDDAKFKLTSQELAIVKSKLEDLRYCHQIDGVYIRIAICAYEYDGKDFLDGKLTFSGDVYFAVEEMLK